MTCLLNSPEQGLALLLSFVTSSIVFVRRTLVLNKYDVIFSIMGFITWLISLTSGLMFWITLNSLRANVVMQLASGALSTIFAWLVYVLLINETIRYPTRQQWMSLAFHISTEAIVLLQVRLILDSIDEGCSI